MRAYSYAWSRDKNGGHTIRLTISENTMVHTNFMAVFYGTGVFADLHCGNRDF